MTEGVSRVVLVFFRIRCVSIVYKTKRCCYHSYEYGAGAAEMVGNCGTSFLSQFDSNA